MSTPKKTKFKAILKLEDTIDELLAVGFEDYEIRELVREILKKCTKRDSKMIGKINKDTVLLKG